MTISLPLKEAFFFEPVWASKTDIFISSVLILTSSETKLFCSYLISAQNFNAAHDRLHLHFSPLSSALKFPESKEIVAWFVLMFSQSYFTTEV